MPAAVSAGHGGREQSFRLVASRRTTAMPTTTAATTGTRKTSRANGCGVPVGGTAASSGTAGSSIAVATERRVGAGADLEPGTGGVTGGRQHRGRQVDQAEDRHAEGVTCGRRGHLPDGGCGGERPHQRDDQDQGATGDQHHRPATPVRTPTCNQCGVPPIHLARHAVPRTAVPTAAATSANSPARQPSRRSTAPRARRGRPRPGRRPCRRRRPGRQTPPRRPCRPPPPARGRRRPPGTHRTAASAASEEGSGWRCRWSPAEVGGREGADPAADQRGGLGAGVRGDRPEQQGDADDEHQATDRDQRGANHRGQQHESESRRILGLRRREQRSSQRARGTHRATVTRSCPEPRSGAPPAGGFGPGRSIGRLPEAREKP